MKATFYELNQQKGYTGENVTMFYKKGVLKHFAKFTGKHLWRISF